MTFDLLPSLNRELAGRSRLEIAVKPRCFGGTETRAHLQCSLEHSVSLCVPNVDGDCFTARSFTFPVSRGRTNGNTEIIPMRNEDERCVLG